MCGYDFKFKYKSPARERATNKRPRDFEPSVPRMNVRQENFRIQHEKTIVAKEGTANINANFEIQGDRMECNQGEKIAVHEVIQTCTQCATPKGENPRRRHDVLHPAWSQSHCERSTLCSV